MVGARFGQFATFNYLGFATEIDERNRQIGVGGVGLTSLFVQHLLGVTVVGSDQALATHFGQGVGHATDAVVNGFTRFDGGIEHTGVTNHVAIRVVTDDDVVLAALDGRNQLVSQLFGAHFRLQVIGRHFRAGHDLAIFAGEAGLFATVEEEGDVSILLGFGDAQLGLALLGQPLTQSVDQSGRRVGTGSFDVGRVFGQHHEVQLWLDCTGEAGEVGVNEGAGDFTGTVGTEVHENQRIAIFHRAASPMRVALTNSSFSSRA